MSVANKKSLFISSVVRFSLAHSHNFCNIFKFSLSAAKCQTILPYSRWLITIYKFSVVRFSLAHSHNFCIASLLPYSAEKCQAVLPSLSAANNNLLFTSPVVRFYLELSHNFCNPFNFPPLLQNTTRSFPNCVANNNSFFISSEGRLYLTNSHAIVMFLNLPLCSKLPEYPSFVGCD